MSISLCMAVYLFVCVYISILSVSSLSFCLFVCMCIGKYVCLKFVCMSVHMFIYLFIHLLSTVRRSYEHIHLLNHFPNVFIIINVHISHA